MLAVAERFSYIRIVYGVLSIMQDCAYTGALEEIMPVYRAFVDNDPAPWRKMAEDRATCPVAHFTEDNGFAYHQVCTYELVREVHRRHDVFLNAPGVSPRGPQPEEERVLTFTDPPRHTR